MNLIREKSFEKQKCNVRGYGWDKRPISTLMGIEGLLYIILFFMSLSSELGWGFWLFIGLLIVVLSYVIINSNRIIEHYIREMKLDKKSFSQFVIITGLFCIILGIVLENFNYRTVGTFLAFMGFLIVLNGLGLNNEE